MPVCEGCGASYENAVKYCPYCGRVKPISDKKVTTQVEVSKDWRCKKCSAPLGKNYQGLYCPKCGTYLFVKCLQCGNANWWDSDFCEKCGIKLAEAKFKISDERRNLWAAHFQEFPGYTKLRNDKEMIKTKQMKRVLDSIFPDQFLIAFGVPIQRKDWCIAQISFREQKITNGLFYVSSDQTRIVDCEQEKGITLFHNELNSVNIEDDNSIKITLTNEKPMRLYFQFPSVGLATAGDIFGFFAGMMGGIALDTLAEMDKPINRIGKDPNENLNAITSNIKQNAPSLKDQINNYRLSVYNLYKEIIETFNERWI